MLMNFPRFNKMKGMGQIVTWSVRDESLHCAGITRLFHAYANEIGGVPKEVKEKLLDHAENVAKIEDKFIDLVFEMGPVHGMTPGDIKKYVRYIADWRLQNLKLPKIFGVDEHPLPWLPPLLNGVEHANFFETRATEYSKATTTGTWNGTWDRFDLRNSRQNGDSDE
jgi:ribonucleoside-diphosphate reductase beta chain